MKEKMPEFEIKRSSRKTLSIEITREAKVLVRAPQRIKRDAIDAFVLKNKAWIYEHIKKMEEKNAREAVDDAKKAELTALAKLIIPKKVESFAKIIRVKPTSVKITSAKTRFGSCSGKNALCFSYRVMLYPKKAIDYVIIHELCHILHHNHSKEFWNEVEKYMPDYKTAENLLKS
ncbi:MAG: M48 family metallopeptidase [Clostridia bacterium]|nr:M48 family metallopeptidase [Clostridia bacterium]